MHVCNYCGHHEEQYLILLIIMLLRHTWRIISRMKIGFQKNGRYGACWNLSPSSTWRLFSREKQKVNVIGWWWRQYFRLPPSYPFFVFLIPFRLKHSYTTMGTLSNGWTLEPNNFQTQRYRTFFRKWISNCLLGFTVIVIDDTDIYVYLSSFFRIWVSMKLNQIAQMLGKIRKTARKTDTAMYCHVSITVLCVGSPTTLAKSLSLK